MRVKNTTPRQFYSTLGFYGQDYITIKRADRLDYKNYITEFLKLRYSKEDIQEAVDMVTAEVSDGYYSVVFFKNNTDVTKCIEARIKKEDSKDKLSKFFNEVSDTVKLTAKPGELAVLYSKRWKLRVTYEIEDIGYEEPTYYEFM